MEIDRLMGSANSVQIIRTRKETMTSTTLEFDLPNLNSDIKAGEFVMVWIPGVDEIPMSVSFWDTPRASITIKEVGDATKHLSSLSVGDWIGIRGPFGNHFTLDAEKALLVGGGIGIAPLQSLVYELLDTEKEVHLIVGAKTKDELILYDFEEIAIDSFHLYITTDDGTVGQKGFVTDKVKELLESYKFDKIYTCGPEMMMVTLLQIARSYGISFEASLERYMKCGCGICGTCGIDSGGELVCIDGPIFTGEKLNKMNDFGQSFRDSTGQKKEF